MKRKNVPVWSVFVLLAFFAAVCIFAADFADNTIENNHSHLPEKADISGFIGETLVYTIQWDPPWYMFFLPKMDAGELTFKLRGIEEYREKPALNVVVEARSSGTLTRLANFNVEDEFLFYSDPETLCARGGMSKISEGKRRRLLELEYLQDERGLLFRATDESVTPPRLLRDIRKGDLPPCVYDPFTALYLYRTLPLTKGYVKNLTIGNDDKVLEVRTKIENQENVNTPAGKFKSWKISTNAMRGGLFRESGDFYVWMAADAPKAPVKFDVKVRFGRVVGILKSVQDKNAGVRR